MTQILTSKKTTPDIETRAVLRELCKTSLFALADHVLFTDFPQNQLSWSFHGRICRWIRESEARGVKKRLFLVARGTFKTYLLNAAQNVQRMLRDPNTRILIGSNKSENAEGMLSIIKGMLSNEKLIWLFPDLLYKDPARDAEEWTKSKVTIRRTRRLREATVETTGIAGELTSRHYDHGTFDDPVGRENSQTRDMLLQTIDFARVVEPLFEPNSTRDYLGTPWHYADLWAWLQEQKAAGLIDLDVYREPAWVSAQDEECVPGLVEDVPGFGRVRATFPERLNIPHLLRLRAEQGPAFFAAQYLLNPVSADTVVFQRDKIHLVTAPECPPLESLWPVMTVDPAISTAKWADFSALGMGGFDSTGDLWILDLRRGKWPEHELINQVYDCVGRWRGRAPLIGFENTAFAKAYRSLFVLEGQRRGVYLNVVKLERDTKITKNTRIRGLEPPWNRGQIHMLRSCQALEDCLDEADRFRYDRESVHDDLLDVLADMYQLRGIPSVQTDAPEGLFDDPEFRERRQFEADLLDRKPGLDQMSLRVAWQMFKQRQDAEQDTVAAGGFEW